MQFKALTFDQLSASLVYKMLQLRIEVFVVEQTCYYQDADGLDTHPETLHLFMLDAENIAAYARILAPDTSYQGCSSIGRILNAKDYRGRGLGHELVAEAVKICEQNWPGVPTKIGAQAHLQGFYNKHQFYSVSDVYLEDGIEHVSMLRQGA